MDTSEPAENESTRTFPASFEELGVGGTLGGAIAALGWTAPTEIQALAVPLALEGRDVIGLAETGKYGPWYSS
jgi:superfamily II DNA/RNA helicase